MSKERIQLTDSMMDIVMKMSEGNPGAVTVIAQLIKNNAQVDPDSLLGELGTVLHLDTAGIYGSNIWMVYKDICGQNIVSFIGLFRAIQMGYMPESELKTALEQPYARLAEGRLNEVLNQVRERLPAFAK